MLETVSTGGLFLAGGVAAKNPIIVENPAFGESVRATRTHRELIGSMPISLMTDEESGLWGAAFAGGQKLGIELAGVA